MAGSASGDYVFRGHLVAPLRDDLVVWRQSSAAALSSPVFPAASGAFWRASDWRNWRKRVYKPLAESVGIDGARPYDLRHAFASPLIHEGRKSVVEIAAQLGHNPTVCLDTYAHVMAEQEGGERIGAEEQIVQARATLTASSANPGAQLTFLFEEPIEHRTALMARLAERHERERDLYERLAQ